MESKGLVKLLVILAGDIEINPGPRFTCITCAKDIRRNQLKAKFKTCCEYFHAKCMIENFDEDLYCRVCHIQPEETGQTKKYCYKELQWLITNRGLKILHQNVNGLLSKINAIRWLLDSQNKTIHIFGITESKLDLSISDTEIRIDGYTGVRYDRKNGAGGGVYVYIRDDLNFQRRTDLESQFIEAVWIEIFIKMSQSILICIAYRPPNSSNYLNKNFDNEFNDMLTTATMDNKEIIHSGDMNCDYSKRSDNRNLKDIIKINGLKQMITEPTRVTESLYKFAYRHCVNNAQREYYKSLCK
jgi:exonuclease III